MPVFKFSGVDFIGLDALLTDDERLVRDTTRRFVEENVVPIIEQCNRDARFPKELIQPMAKLGYFVLGCPPWNQDWLRRNWSAAIAVFAPSRACKLRW